MHWKSPISILETTSLTPFYFNFHKEDVGHISLLGSTGTGKTVLQSFLAAQSQRLKNPPKLIFFDKDRGCQIFVEAMGGNYEVLEKGYPTGLNPLLLDNTPENREFLVTLFNHILKPKQGGVLKTVEQKILRSAIEHILDAEPEARTLAELQILLTGQQVASDDDLAARLEPWIDPNQDGWLFAGSSNQTDLNHHIFGFDMTSILDDADQRTALLMLLFHKIEQMLTGEPIIIFLDEAWKLLQDEAFSHFIMDKLKTLRKLNGLIVFTTQSASDIVKSNIAATLIEQTSTNIFLPNSKANINDYKEPFSLSDREFEWIKTTNPQSRLFLIKQADASVVGKLDLSNMPDYIKVLSGRAETIKEMQKLKSVHGSRPEDWLPHFANIEMEAANA